jgi:hypothetical protein
MNGVYTCCCCCCSAPAAKALLSLHLPALSREARFGRLVCADDADAGPPTLPVGRSPAECRLDSAGAGRGCERGPRA